MDAILDLPTPQGCSTDLVGAPVAFDHQQVATPEPEAFDFSLKELNLVNIVEI